MKRMILIMIIVCFFVSSNIQALTNAERVKKIEERYKKGEISQEMYLMLKKKYSVEEKEGSTSGKSEPTKKSRTNAERVKKIEERYKKGEISEAAYLRLKEKYSAKPGYLKVTMQVERLWARCVFGPEKAVKYSKVPQTVSIFMTREPSSAVKPYVLIKDADGEVFSFIYFYTLMRHLEQGEARVVELKDEKIDISLSENLVNGTIDPPVELFGLSFPCRAAASFSVVLGEISFDGQVVEDFSQETKWKPLEVDDEVKLKLTRISRKIFVQSRPPQSGHPNEWKFPGNLTNFIPSGRFEEGEGIPAGWYHGDKTHIPPDEVGDPVDDPSQHKANYFWEDDGVQGSRSLSFEVDQPGCWGGWDYQLKKVKPNTVYTISFWYRQPKPGALKLHILGETISMNNLHIDNPAHWVRYSRHFNSKDFSGNLDIGFHAYCLKEPVKIWLDEVELYEGFSPIGYNLCRMQYYYYNYMPVSPDMLSPVGFAFEHLFDNKHQPKEIDYILELPRGIKLEGFWAAYYTWLKEHYRLNQEKIKVEGRPYTRYIMTLKIRGDEKTRNHLVTIPRRDTWEGCVGSYCGMKQLHCWLSTTLKSGELKGRYYARWLSGSGGKGGQQQPQIFKIKVVRVPEVKPFKRFRVWAETDGVNLATCPDLVNGFVRVGVNGIGGHLHGEKGNLEPARKSEIRDAYTWYNQPVYFANDDLEADGMNVAGRRHREGAYGCSDWLKPGWCLSYRGPKWQERVEYTKKRIEAGVSGFWFDDYSFCNCYCPKCKERFKEFLKKFTSLPYNDPAEFMSNPGSQPKYEALWKDFAIYHYGITAKILKAELEKYVEEKNLPYKVTFTLSGIPPPEHPFAWAGCKEAFDSFSGQFYIHCYSGAYFGSPKRIGDGIAKTYAKMGSYAMDFTPLLGPGLVYMHPANAIEPYEVMKYQILETVFALPLKGYAVYAGRDTDLGILINMGAANRIITTYEDIILDGEVVTEGLKGSGPKGSLRVKKLGERMLILVSDYTTFGGKKTVLKIGIPPVKKKSILTDAETGKKLAELKAGQGDFEVEINTNRARVFLCEPK